MTTSSYLPWLSTLLNGSQVISQYMLTGAVRGARVEFSFQKGASGAIKDSDLVWNSGNKSLSFLTFIQDTRIKLVHYIALIARLP